MNKSDSDKNIISLLGLSIWLLAAFFFLYEFFLRTFIGSVAHQVIPDLGLNAETFSILGSAYYATYALMQIPVGILADKFGVKAIMIFATLICALATYLFASANGFYTALLSRCLMGFGSSFAFLCLLVVAVTWFPRKYFGFFAGASQFIGTMGPLLAGGPLLTLMAAYHESWRTALFQVGTFGIILAIFIFFVVKNKPRDSNGPIIILQPKEPMTKSLKRLFKNRQAWVIALYSACSYVSIALLGAIWGTEYLQVQGLKQSSAGDIISIAWLGYALGCPILGALSDATKRRKPFLIICALFGLISTGLITYAPIGQSFIGFSLLFFMLGIAASGQNIGFAAISEHVEIKSRSTALGLNNATITSFGAILPPCVSYFIYLSAGTTSKLAPHDFTLAFTTMPILYVLSLLIAIFLFRETFCKPQKEVLLARHMIK